MKKIIFITILSIIMFTGCAATEITNEKATITTIQETEPSITDAEPVMAIPADLDPQDPNFQLEYDFTTALSNTPQPWTMMPLDGSAVTDEFILQTAYITYEMNKDTEDKIISDENGVYLPVETVQNAADLLFAVSPEIETYSFGSLYRNNAEYKDYIFLPLDFYEKDKFYEKKYSIENSTFRYDTGMNIITCALNYNKIADDGGFLGIDCRKEFSLSPFIINGNTYYRYNELLDYEVYNINPARQTDAITDYRDWEQLGISKIDERYIFIKAFVNGDVKMLEHMAQTDKSVYESYKSIVLGEYTIKRVDKNPIYPDAGNSDNIIFDFDIISSDNEVLCPGHHSFFIEAGLCMKMIDYTDYVWDPELNKATEAQKLIRYYRGTSFPDFKAKTNDGNYNISTEYIIARLNYLSGNYEPRSTEEIIAYAKKYFDIDDYKINEYGIEKYQDGYAIIGRGVASPSYSFISEEIRDGITVVTVQFWADFSQTVKSVLVEFYLEELDSDFKPLYSVTLDDSGYKTSYIGA